MKKSVRFLAFAVLAGSIFAVTGCSDPHSHSYSSEWSNDETNHWHAATCGHEELKKDEGAHEGMEDGYCDVCHYHVHLFDETKYEFDETNHWFADTCGHEQKKGVEEHTPDKLGVCTVCENKVAEPDLSTVAKAMAIGIMQKGEVNKGTVVKATNYTDPSMNDHTVNGYFELGEDSFYMSETYGNSKVEIWYAIVNDVTVGFEKRDDGDLVWHNEEFEAEAINGYYFDGNEIGNAGNKSYGVEDYLETLYEVGDVKAMDGTFVESVNEGVYSFAYDLYVNDSSNDVLNVAVSFELGEKYNVEKMTIVVNRWYYATEILDDKGVGTGVYEKPVDETTGEVTTPDEVITTTITQETGALIEQDVKPEEMLLSSFELYNGEEKVEEELTLVCGTQLKLDVKNLLPESASDMTYDAITLTGINAETGDEISIGLLSSQYMGYYYKSSQQLGLNFKVLGTYEVTIHTRTLSKTITVNVVRPATTELNVQVGGKNATTASVFLGDDISFATTANTYADASATAVFTSKPDGSTLIDADILVNQSTGMFVFEPDVAGTYEITLTSVANPELEKTLTVTVEEKPNVGNVLSGTYTGNLGSMYGTVTAVLTPDATPVQGAEYSGTFTIKAEGGMVGAMSNEGTWTYTTAGGFVCAQTGLHVRVDSSFVVSCYNNSYVQGTLTKVAGSEVEPDEPTSPWEGSGTSENPYVITDLNTEFTVSANYETQLHYIFTADKSGTLTLTFDTSDLWVELNDGNYPAELEIGEGNTDTTFTATLVEGTNYTLLIGSWDAETLDIGVTMSFVEGEVGGDEGGDEKEPVMLVNGDNTITVTADDITAESITCTFMPMENGTYEFTGMSVNVYNWDGTLANRGYGYLEAWVNYTVVIYFVEDVEVGEYTLTISMEAEEGGEDEGDDQVFVGTEDNPYVVEVDEETTIEVTSAFTANNYFVYVSVTVPVSGWYAFQGYWATDENAKVIETSDGVYIYAEANSTIVASQYVDAEKMITLTVVEQEMNVVSAGNGDSVENGISVVGEGSYGMTLDYAVSANGLYVNFTVTEAGYYTFSFSNFNNILTYNGETYCSNDNGDLILYAETGVTYSFLLDNVGFDDNYQPIDESGSFFFNVEKLTNLTVGENTVIGNGEETKLVVVVVETAGNYVISIEDLGAESINLWGDVISVNGYNWGYDSVYSVTVELEAGVAYTTTITFPSDESWNPMSGSWKITIAEASAEEEEVGTPLVLGNNSVSQKDVVYAYTATEEGTLTLSFGGWVMSQGNIIYTVNGANTGVLEANSPVNLSLVAGDKVVIAVVANGGYATIIASWALPSTDEGGDDSTGSEEGGEATISGTYMSEKHGSGRYLKVIIDETASTMTLIRSNMSGGWDAQTSTAEYTYSFDGTTVTATNVSGQVCNFVWGADGLPTSITWGSADFVNFVKQ